MSWKLTDAIDYYRQQGAPGDQNALIQLLREVQQEYGGSIPVWLPASAAEALGVKESYLLAIIKRIPSLRLADSHCLELCAGPNCSKRAALAAYVEQTWGTAPARFTVRFVPCMRMCGKGPNVKWDGKLYHQVDAALLHRLIEG